MSKAQFAEAKALIDAKRYAEARRLLKTIDHPTAREWEAKLDKAAPIQRSAPRTLILVILAVIGLVIVSQLPSGGTPVSSPSPAPTTTADIEATSAAAGTALTTALEQSPDLEGVRAASALELTGGWAVSVDVSLAGADNSEATMERLRLLALDVTKPIEQMRVSSFINDTLTTTWLWEAGAWTRVDV